MTDENVSKGIPDAIQDEITRFGSWLNQFSIAEGTKKVYIIMVKRFLLDGQPLTQENVNLFIRAHNRHYTRGAMLHFCRFRGVMFDIYPVRETPRKIKKIPEPQELKNIMEKLKGLDINIYMTLRTAIVTGARIHEVLKLRLVDITDDGILFPTTKTGEPRKVLMLPWEIKEIREYTTEERGALAGDRVFFPKCKNIKSAYYNMLFIINNTAQLTKDEKKFLKNTHNCRRSLINEVLEATGYNIMATASYVGQHPSTTWRYASESQKEGARILALESLRIKRENDGKSQTNQKD